jgi:hypothetical protein
MATLQGIFGNAKGFDASQVEPSEDFQPLPAGDYKAILSESEVAPNKAGTGKNLKLKFQVIDGPHKKRTLYSWLAVLNPSEVAQRIAHQNFSALCHAVGVLKVTDTSQLHGKPLLIAVGFETNHRGEPANVIKGYKPLQAAKQATESATEELPLEEEDVPW